MRYAVEVGAAGEGGSPSQLAELARVAEDSGWDAILLEDYLVHHTARDRPTWDPWVCLAAMASATTTILIGTGVTPLPRRRPWELARQAAAVHELSGGRLILGVGLGDVNDHAWAATGEPTDLAVRGQRFDESLAILRGLWSGEPFSFAGRHYHLEEVIFRPAAQGIRIWVGGSWPGSSAVLRRAALGDGACLYPRTADGAWRDFTVKEIHEMREGIAGLRSSPAPYDFSVGGRDRSDPEQDIASIESAEEAGATWWMEYVPPGEFEQVKHGVARGPLRKS